MASSSPSPSLSSTAPPPLPSTAPATSVPPSSPIDPNLTYRDILVGPSTMLVSQSFIPPIPTFPTPPHTKSPTPPLPPSNTPDQSSVQPVAARQATPLVISLTQEEKDRLYQPWRLSL
ncbi:hypothetical protein SLA2020_228670 [Shorea laevis]